MVVKVHHRDYDVVKETLRFNVVWRYNPMKKSSGKKLVVVYDVILSMTFKMQAERRPEAQ